MWALCKCKGFNLDKVGAVKVDEIEAVIVENNDHPSI